MDLKKYQDNINFTKTQYITTDHKGYIVETCNSLFTLKKNNYIGEDFPFFDSFTELLAKKTEKEYVFSCIHFNTEDKQYIVDVILNTFTDKPALISIQDFTTHYNNYQFAAQERNESIISNEKLELQNQFLKEKERFKTEFIANFSHELREPLDGILAFSDFLSKTDLDYQQKSYLDIITSSSNTLKLLIDDILDLQTLKIKEHKNQKQIINPTVFFKEIQIIYKAKAEKKGLQFKTKTLGNLPEYILVDKIRLRQIFNNLLSNAIKFTPTGSIYFEISFNHERANKYNISFAIKDSGIGIKDEQLNHIFKSFVKTDSLDSNEKSYGLGLAIVKELVDTFEGKIDVTSKVNKGTTFTVNLNFKKPKKENINLIQTNKKAQLNIKKPIKILAVENSEIIQLILMKIVAKHKNIQLDINPNPDKEQLIDTLEISDYDMVFMDIKLNNGQNGLDLISKIKKHRSSDLKNLPIIALTGNVLKTDLKAYKKAKVTSVLKKPFTETDFINCIASILE